MIKAVSQNTPGRTSRRLVDDLLFASGLLVCVIGALFLLLPLGIMVLMAFDARGYLGPLPPPEFSLRWFERFFGDPYFLKGLRTSLVLATLTTCISVAVGVATAVAMGRMTFRGKDALAAFFLSPLIVPPVVIGFALLLFLAQLGIQDGFVRLLCGHVIITVPYTIRATIASMGGIDRSLTEAALNLGANDHHAFWEITFPLARTGIITGAVFAFAVSMDDVAVAMFLTDAQTYTLPVALISSMRANFDLTIAAASFLLVLVTLVLILLLDALVGLNRIIGQGVYRS